MSDGGGKCVVNPLGVKAGLWTLWTGPWTGLGTGISTQILDSFSSFWG